MTYAFQWENFQINLESNDNQSGLIFCGDNSVCINFPSPRLFFMNMQCRYRGITWRQTLQECLEFITFHYSRCCIVCVKTMRSNSETDRNKSAQYKVNGFYRKFFKKSDKFLKYARAYLCKGCYSPAWAREDMALQIGDNLQTFVWWGWGEEGSLCPPAYKRL